MTMFTIKELSEKTGINQKTIRKILKKEGFINFKVEGRTHLFPDYALDCLQYYKKFVRKSRKLVDKSIENTAQQSHVLPTTNENLGATIPCFDNEKLAQQFHVLRTELDQCKAAIKLMAGIIRKLTH